LHRIWGGHGSIIAAPKLILNLVPICCAVFNESDSKAMRSNDGGGRPNFALFHADAWGRL